MGQTNSRQTVAVDPQSPTLSGQQNGIASPPNGASEAGEVIYDRYLGLQNFGNTCYCNSVLQVLFYCDPFRRQCLKHRNDGDGMLSALSELFSQIEQQRKTRGGFSASSSSSVAPKKFIQKLRQENELFRSADHHDAHEFFNFLMNDIAEYLIKRDQQQQQVSNPRPPKSWVHSLFEGSLVYETKCLCCENVTRRREPFLDLSVEVQQEDCTLEKCIMKFSSKEKLGGKDKYFCDNCSCLQEAERFSSIGTLPPFLAVHLKRFKFDEQRGRYARLQHRVEFPMQLSLPCCDAAYPKKTYELFAVIVHIGTSMSHGHYVCCVRSNEKWYLFDDHVVTSITSESLSLFYGASKDGEGVKCGYLIFYSAKPNQLESSNTTSSSHAAVSSGTTAPPSASPSYHASHSATSPLAAGSARCCPSGGDTSASARTASSTVSSAANNSAVGGARRAPVCQSATSSYQSVASAESSFSSAASGTDSASATSAATATDHAISRRSDHPVQSSHADSDSIALPSSGLNQSRSSPRRRSPRATRAVHGVSLADAAAHNSEKQIIRTHTSSSSSSDPKRQSGRASRLRPSAVEADGYGSSRCGAALSSDVVEECTRDEKLRTAPVAVSRQPAALSASTELLGTRSSGISLLATTVAVLPAAHGTNAETFMSSSSAAAADYDDDDDDTINYLNNQRQHHNSDTSTATGAGGYPAAAVETLTGSETSRHTSPPQSTARSSLHNSQRSAPGSSSSAVRCGRGIQRPDAAARRRGGEVSFSTAVAHGCYAPWDMSEGGGTDDVNDSSDDDSCKRPRRRGSSVSSSRSDEKCAASLVEDFHSCNELPQDSRLSFKNRAADRRLQQLASSVSLSSVRHFNEVADERPVFTSPHKNRHRVHETFAAPTRAGKR